MKYSGGLSRCFRWDQHLVGNGLGSRSDSEEEFEGGMAGAAAVEAEDELVEVGLQVLVAQAVVDAERPCLEVGEDAVDPRQHDMGGHGADDMGVVPDPRRPGVGAPAVGPGDGAQGRGGSGRLPAE